MNKEIFYNKKLLFLPAIISFIISLLLIFKFSFPISWDVYYHVHMINLYIVNGIVFWDYQTVAPIGRAILYPPFFHLILAGISSFTGISPMDLCRYLQPIFAFLMIFVITYVNYKFSENIKTGFLTGFLALSCFTTFNRGILCTPGTIAMMCFMLSSLFFYNGINNSNLKQIILSAIILGIIFNLHMATALLNLAVFGVYSLFLIFQRKCNIKYLIYFILIMSIIATPWWMYMYINYGISLKTYPGSNISLINFLFKYYGIIHLVFTITGGYVIKKDLSNKNIFLLLWSLTLIFFSLLHYLGMSLEPKRILEVASYPLIIIAGMGLIHILNHIKSFKTRKIFTIILIVFSILSCLMYVDSYTPDLLEPTERGSQIIPYEIHLIIDPIGTIYKPTIISNRFGNTILAHDRYNVICWFKNNSQNNKIVVSEDSILDTLIVSITNNSVIYGGFTESIPTHVIDPMHIVNGYSTKTEIHDLSLGYLIVGKNTNIPKYAKLEYKNRYYKICTINENYIT